MKQLIDNFRLDASEASMRNLVQCVRTRAATDDDIAYLATVLADSGARLAINATERSADLASTGGPTSLSTLLSPLYLRALGCFVPKLGVPGRPAGGVDVLAQIPGYRVHLNSKEVEACIERCGYAHFAAGSEHAPLDARLFEYRRHSGAQNIPELATASLLSKKIAVGLQRAGLDIRVAPHGNFGDTWLEALENGRRFVRVASLVGIEAVCFLTEARMPYQPYVGRGEALIALHEILYGVPDSVLKKHASLCLAMAVATSGDRAIDLNKVVAESKNKFVENLEAQGGSTSGFLEYVDVVRRGHRFNFIASEDGFVSIHLERLRDLIIRFQGVVSTGNKFPDEMGVILCKMPGEIAYRNDVLATVRVPQNDWQLAEQELRGVFELTDSLRFAGGFERVTNG